MPLPPDVDAASTSSLNTPSTTWAKPPQAPFALRNYEPNPWHNRRQNSTSAAWTTSSGELADFSDTDDGEVRDEFVRVFNRTAKKVGIVIAIAVCTSLLTPAAWHPHDDHRQTKTLRG